MLEFWPVLCAGTDQGASLEHRPSSHADGLGRPNSSGAEHCKSAHCSCHAAGPLLHAPEAESPRLMERPASPSGAAAVVTARHRAVLVDWVLDVAEEFMLRGDTIFLAIDLLDRRLATQEESTDWLQLLGLACIWVAAKVEEKLVPGAADMISLTEGLYSAAELLHMEQLVIMSSSSDVSPAMPLPDADLGTLSRPTAYTVLCHMLHLSHCEQLYGVPQHGTGARCLLCFWAACEGVCSRSAASHNGSSHSASSTSTQQPGGSVHGSGSGFAVVGAEFDAIAEEVLSWKGDGQQEPDSSNCPMDLLLRLPTNAAPVARPHRDSRRSHGHHHHHATHHYAEVHSARISANPRAGPQPPAAAPACLATWPHCGQGDLSGHMVVGDDDSQWADDEEEEEQQDDDDLAMWRAGARPDQQRSLSDAALQPPPPPPPAPEAHVVLEHFSPGVSARDPEPGAQMRLVYMARLMAEACLLDHTLMACPPTQVAAGCLMLARAMMGLAPWSAALAEVTEVPGPEATAACVVAAADAFERARTDPELLSLQRRYGQRRMHVLLEQPTGEALALVASCRLALAQQAQQLDEQPLPPSRLDSGIMHSDAPWDAPQATAPTEEPASSCQQANRLALHLHASCLLTDAAPAGASPRRPHACGPNSNSSTATGAAAAHAPHPANDREASELHADDNAPLPAAAALLQSLSPPARQQQQAWPQPLRAAGGGIAQPSPLLTFPQPPHEPWWPIHGGALLSAVSPPLFLDSEAVFSPPSFVPCIPDRSTGALQHRGSTATATSKSTAAALAVSTAPGPSTTPHTHQYLRPQPLRPRNGGNATAAGLSDEEEEGEEGEDHLTGLLPWQPRFCGGGDGSMSCMPGVPQGMLDGGSGPPPGMVCRSPISTLAGAADLSGRSDACTSAAMQHGRGGGGGGGEEASGGSYAPQCSGSGGVAALMGWPMAAYGSRH